MYEYVCMTKHTICSSGTCVFFECSVSFNPTEPKIHRIICRIILNRLMRRLFISKNTAKTNRIYHLISSGKSSDILEVSSSESPPVYRPTQGLFFFLSVPLDKLWVSRPTLKSSHKNYLPHPSKLVILYHPVT